MARLYFPRCVIQVKFQLTNVIEREEFQNVTDIVSFHKLNIQALCLIYVLPLA